MDVSFDGRRERAAWAVFGAAVTAVVAYALYSLVGAIVTGLFLYYAVRPVSRWLDERTTHPDVAATAALLVVGLPILVVLVYGGLVGVRELDQLLRQAQLQQFRQYLRPYPDLASLTDPRRLRSLLGDGGLLAGLGNTVPGVAALLGSAFVWGVRLFVIFAVAFYLLRDDFKIARWVRETFDEDGDVVAFLESVDDDLTTIYTGNLITVGVSGLVAVVVYFGLDSVAPPGTGVAFPVLLGLLTGVATLVPAVGMKLVYVPYAAYLGWRSTSGQGVPLWFPVAFFLVVFLVVDTFPDFFIRSYVSKAGHSMGVMLLTYVVGAFAFGWYGIFLGPLLLVLFLQFARHVLPDLLEAGPRRLASE